MRVDAMAPSAAAGRSEGGKAAIAWSAVREALRPRAVSGAPPSQAEAARALATLDPGVLGVVFFGSQRTKASPDRFSAHDLFVVVEAYRPFYEALHAAGHLRRGPRLMAALSAVLTPSQISLRLPDGQGSNLHAKCSIITLDHLRRETSPRRRDHFTIGRLFQPAEIVFARDPTAQSDVLDALASAAAATYLWGRPFLPKAFDADAYLLTVLRVSLGREVRPEPTGRRAEALHEAQRDEQLPVFRALLQGLHQDGELRLAGEPVGNRAQPRRSGAVAVAEDGSGVVAVAKAPGVVAVAKGEKDASGGTTEPFYGLARPVGSLERLRVGLYFRVSILRATLRWFKYIVTFDEWLDYLLRKVERHTGQKVELTPRERAHPLVFLWPRIYRYLRDKDDSASKAS
jgi:hypothetical protein